jgi:hypothetical protein
VLKKHKKTSRPESEDRRRAEKSLKTEGKQLKTEGFKFYKRFNKKAKENKLPKTIN